MSPLIPFSILNNISILVKRHNFTLVFFQDQVHIFQDTYFESYQIHQVTIMYGFEHTNHDIPPNFLFQKLMTCLCTFLLIIE